MNLAYIIKGLKPGRVKPGDVVRAECVDGRITVFVNGEVEDWTMPEEAALGADWAVDDFVGSDLIIVPNRKGGS